MYKVCQGNNSNSSTIISKTTTFPTHAVFHSLGGLGSMQALDLETLVGSIPGMAVRINIVLVGPGAQARPPHRRIHACSSCYFNAMHSKGYSGSDLLVLCLMSVIHTTLQYQAGSSEFNCSQALR
jgi:hypothetical protein